MMKHLTIKEKIDTIVRSIWRNRNKIFTVSQAEIKKLEQLGLKLPNMLAKLSTHYPISNFTWLPERFYWTVNDIKISNGAGFILLFLGDL